MSIFLSRSKAWDNRTTAACTCQHIYSICNSDIQTAKDIRGQGTLWGNKNSDILHKLFEFVSPDSEHSWTSYWVLDSYKTIPHSTPWRLAGARVSCRRQTCGTGSSLDTWGSNPCRSHWRAQLLYMGRTGLSHSPVGICYRWVRPLIVKWLSGLLSDENSAFDSIMGKVELS